VTADGLVTIAHRRGNTVDGLREAQPAGVHNVYSDVHANRGRLEVPHL
jgi:hypothetical protein